MAPFPMQSHAYRHQEASAITAPITALAGCGVPAKVVRRDDKILITAEIPRGGQDSLGLFS